MEKDERKTIRWEDEFGQNEIESITLILRYKLQRGSKLPDKILFLPRENKGQFHKRLQLNK